MSNSNYLLSKILDCGTADLVILNEINIEHDIFDVYQSLENELGDSQKPSFKDLFLKIVSIALNEMHDQIKQYIADIGDEEVKETLAALDPNEDFEVNFNFSASYIVCCKNKETYGWHPEWINEFRKKVGYITIIDVPEINSLLKKSKKVAAICSAVEKTLEKYNADEIDLVKEADKVVIVYHSKNNSFIVFACDVANLHEVDIIEIADKYNIGYCW